MVREGERTSGTEVRIKSKVNRRRIHSRKTTGTEACRFSDIRHLRPVFYRRILSQSRLGSTITLQAKGERGYLQPNAPFSLIQITIMSEEILHSVALSSG